MTVRRNTAEESELARWRTWAAQVLTDRGLNPSRWGDEVRRRMIDRAIHAAAVESEREPTTEELETQLRDIGVRFLEKKLGLKKAAEPEAKCDCNAGPGVHDGLCSAGLGVK